MPRGHGSDTLRAGEPAPDFDLPVAGEDRRVRRTDFQGHWLLLVFLRHVW
ncbi:MAG: redoxin domain-containing protein [Actinobacteria bacterium]|nr:redoxin domain-containing protein [Actinomycetota bacterium]